MKRYPHPLTLSRFLLRVCYSFVTHGKNYPRKMLVVNNMQGWIHIRVYFAFDYSPFGWSGTVKANMDISELRQAENANYKRKTLYFN